MPAGYGFASHVGFAKESSGGTATAATDYVEALSESLALEIDRFDTKNITGKFAEPDDEAGVKRVSGDVVFPAVPDPLGFFLLGATGVQSNTEVLSGFLHKHEFTMRTSDWDNLFAGNPFTFEIFRDVTSSQRYAGCVINTLEFNVTPNQDLRATASLIGKSADDISKTTPSFVNSPVSPLAFDTASIEIGGGANAQLEGLTISIDNQLEGVPFLNNSDEIRAIRRTGPQLIRVSGTIAFEDITEYRNFVDQTEQIMKASFFRADSFQMIVDMPRVVYTSFPLAVGGRERQTVGFEGRARYDTGSNSAIKIDLTNTTSGY